MTRSHLQWDLTSRDATREYGITAPKDSVFLTNPTSNSTCSLVPKTRLPSFMSTSYHAIEILLTQQKKQPLPNARNHLAYMVVHTARRLQNHFLVC